MCSILYRYNNKFMIKNITSKQQKVLKYYDEYIKKN